MASVHDGHRARMRERIERSGLSSLQDHEVLEYLLYPFVPRKDTNEIAHALLDKFGSFSGIINADAKHIEDVPGVTANAALFLASLSDVFRLYITDMKKPKTSLKGRGVARNFMGSQLYGMREESVIVAGLDAQDQLIMCRQISQGSGDSVGLSVRNIVDFALSNKASSILLAHNHPSGHISPSQDDINLTKELYITLANVGVTLQDHFIFADGEYYSFEEKGHIERIKNATNRLKEGLMFYE